MKLCLIMKFYNAPFLMLMIIIKIFTLLNLLLKEI